MAEYNYSLKVVDCVDYYEAPIEEDNYERLTESLEYYGKVLIAEQREDCTFFSGVLSSLESLDAIRRNLVCDEGTYPYEWTFSNWPIKTEADDKEHNREVEVGCGYRLKLCNSVESPDGGEIYYPIHEESFKIVNMLLGSGEVQIAEQRDNYTYFEGTVPALIYLRVLDYILEQYKYDLTISNYRY